MQPHVVRSLSHQLHISCRKNKSLCLLSEPMVQPSSPCTSFNTRWGELCCVNEIKRKTWQELFVLDAGAYRRRAAMASVPLLHSGVGALHQQAISQRTVWVHQPYWHIHFSFITRKTAVLMLFRKKSQLKPPAHITGKKSHILPLMNISSKSGQNWLNGLV